MLVGYLSNFVGFAKQIGLKNGPGNGNSFVCRRLAAYDDLPIHVIIFSDYSV